MIRNTKMKNSVFNLNLMNTLFVIWKRNLWNGCVLSYLSFRYLRSKEQLMNVREMSSIHSAQNSLALWWIHKGCKNHFKTILDWCDFFLFYIFCVLGFCDIYLQKMWIRPYDMLYTIENHELKIRNIIVSRSSIYIYILYHMILQSVFHVWEIIFVSYSNAFYDAYCNNSFSLCLISDPFVIEIYQDTCIIHVE